MNGKPARDKNGEIVGAAHGSVRCANADSLFPVLSRVWRVNNSAPTGQNFIVYGKKPFIMPTDTNARFGPAACEEKVMALVLPDQDRIHFYDRSVAPHRKNTRHINWLPLSTPGRKAGDPAVYLADCLKEFRLKDIPFHLYGEKAFLSFRGVKITISADANGRHYSNLSAGQLCVRTGYPDRIEAVKKTATGKRVLGRIAIVDSCLIVGNRRIPLDQPGNNASFAIEDVIEGLGGREVKLEPGRLVYALGLRLPFPENVGDFYRPKLLAGQIYCHIYRNRLVAGYKEHGCFTEIGRVLEAEIERSGRKQPRVDLVELIPELGRCEEKLLPGNKITAREANYRLNLLKRQSRRLADARPGSPEISELFIALSCGLAWLDKETELSADLRTSLADEIRTALKPWRSHYLRLKFDQAVAVKLPVKLEAPPELEMDLSDSLDDLAEIGRSPSG